MRKWKKKVIITTFVLAWAASALSGCGGQAALEDRTYVESLHIIPEGEAYQYQCTLSYVDSNSMKYLRVGLDGAVMDNDNTGEKGRKSTEASEGKSGNTETGQDSGTGGNGEGREGSNGEGNGREGSNREETDSGNGSNGEGRGEEAGSGEEGNDKGENSEGVGSIGGSSEEGGKGEEESSNGEGSEYRAVANNMTEFNQEYYRLTGSNFDYSHLQGIYLDASLYQSGLAEEVLEDIWEATQAVLSTPIYQEGVEIGDQKEETLGDWLKAGR